ncbi:hypothetical protein KDW_54280 [Dictyobacter vulcani]|uniref:Uncharacterized protein n=1 Tax=Dictyobacter vulcani TaxID=2607529 RepID=A0A5J4L1C4_9CHLR|nr:hypothetical protein [Dictyobacter vulcani]GER91266.1 hypothetical protein KDW_54280 [Dictyobacter vulcani]
MPNITCKKDLIEYFEEKSQRHANEGEVYVQTVNDILATLNEKDDITELKSLVRRLHREKLREIQRSDVAETRVELRKQLTIYDDFLTQIRAIPVQ